MHKFTLAENWVFYDVCYSELSNKRASGQQKVFVKCVIVVTVWDFLHMWNISGLARMWESDYQKTIHSKKTIFKIWSYITTFISKFLEGNSITSEKCNDVFPWMLWWGRLEFFTRNHINGYWLLQWIINSFHCQNSN